MVETFAGTAQALAEGRAGDAGEILGDHGTDLAIDVLVLKGTAKFTKTLSGKGVHGGVESTDAPKTKLAEANKQINVLQDKCFAPETLVRTPDGQRPIGEIRQGDLVLAYDHKAGEWCERQVEKFHESIYEGPLLTVHTDGGPVRTTIHHPFWVLNGYDLDERQAPRELEENEDEGLSLPGRWVNSHELRCGDVLIGQDGQQHTVLRIEQEFVTAFLVHNLTISDDHTFAVGADGLLVHNTAECFRGGSASNGNLTPRPQDVDGLSARVKPPKGKSQAIDTSKLDKLEAVQNGADHVSIRPKDRSRMQEWIDSRGGDTAHEFTEELRGAIDRVERN